MEEFCCGDVESIFTVAPAANHSRIDYRVNEEKDSDEKKKGSCRQPNSLSLRYLGHVSGENGPVAYPKS